LKTSLEQQFEKRVLYHICTRDISLGHRISLLLDFHNNGCKYYEELCDILYAASTNSSPSSIWMTESGRFYILPHKQKDTDLCLCACSDIPPFNGDLVDQLEHIFLCIYQKMMHSTNAMRSVPTL